MREALAGTLCEAGDVAAYAHRLPEPPILAEDRRADARDARLPLRHALSPSPDPYSPELRRVRPVIDTARREGEQYLPRRPAREGHDGAYGHRVPQTRHPLHG